MQPGGRSGDRAQRLGIDRLVLLAIERRVRAIDVWRQRNVSDALEHAEEIGDRIEAEMALAEFAAGDDLGSEFVRLLGRVERRSRRARRFPACGRDAPAPPTRWARLKAAG